jgi:hypothetical protein
MEQEQSSMEKKSVEGDLRSSYQATVDQFLHISSSIDAALKNLADKEARWHKLDALMEENIAKAKHKIKLDVGGKCFATSKTSLLRFEGSFFWTMLAGGRWAPNEEDGAYFIDRNPKHFDRILDYHRTGEFDVEGLDNAAHQQLERDFDFFQLPPPPNWPQPIFPSLVQQPLAWDPNYRGTKQQLSDGNKTVKKASGLGWDAGVLATEAVSSYKIKVTDHSSNGNVMVGFAPRSGFQPNGQNYHRCGYYLYLASGTLFSGHGQFSARYTQPINHSDIITITYDATSRQISFARNGQQLGVAFNNVVPGPLFLWTSAPQQPSPSCDPVALPSTYRAMIIVRERERRVLCG